MVNSLLQVANRQFRPSRKNSSREFPRKDSLKIDKKSILMEYSANQDSQASNNIQVFNAECFPTSRKLSTETLKEIQLVNLQENVFDQRKKLIFLFRHFWTERIGKRSLGRDVSFATRKNPGYSSKKFYLEIFILFSNNWLFNYHNHNIHGHYWALSKFRLHRKTFATQVRLLI